MASQLSPVKYYSADDKNTHLTQFPSLNPTPYPSPNQRRSWYNPTLCVKRSGGKCAKSRGDNASRTMHNIVT